MVETAFKQLEQLLPAVLVGMAKDSGHALPSRAAVALRSRDNFAGEHPRARQLTFELGGGGGGSGSRNL